MRCFIAIDFPAEEKAKTLLEELGKIKGTKCVSSLHLTLNFIGEIEDVERAKSAIEELRGQKKFRAELKGVGAFPDEKKPRVVWLGVEDDNVSAAIAEKLCKVLKNCDKTFLPHITLARVKYEGDREKISNFIERHKSEYIGSYEVTRIYLKKSTLTQKGPIYENLYELELL